jgi:outer membrane usher protein FimD/PapC
MRQDGFHHAYAQATGSLVWMGGHAFAARSIQDAFAVVSTAGLSGIPVKLENRVVGRTDARGLLLVTPLNAWQRNKLSIDPMDLPADLRVTEVDRIATPGDRAGVRVGFAIAPVRAAVLVLREQQPTKIVVAVPTASAKTCDEFRDQVDDIICAVTPEPFYAVGLWYQDFSQTSDEEVRELLARASQAQSTR